MNTTSHQPLEDQIATLGDITDAIAPYNVTPCLTIQFTGAAWRISFPVDTRVCPTGSDTVGAHSIELAVARALHAAKYFDAELDKIVNGALA